MLKNPEFSGFFLFSVLIYGIIILLLINEDNIMQFKGFNFRRNYNVVNLPTHDISGNLMPYVDADRLGYIVFGKVCKKGQIPNNAVRTNFYWADDEDKKHPVYAVPIDLKGYSLTNMAYGNDKKVYLAKDGGFYTAKSNAA